MEEIIRCVKEHPILYDNKKTPNSVKKKKENWEEIALDLGQSVEVVKRKWAYLRECYLKSIREGKDKKWQWGKEMEFLRPHLKSSKDDKNATADKEQLNGTMSVSGSDGLAPRKERRMSMYSARPPTPTFDDDDDDFAKLMQSPFKLLMDTNKSNNSEHKKSKSEKKANKLNQSEHQPEEQKLPKSEKKLHKSEKKAKKLEEELQETAHKRENSSMEGVVHIEPTPKKPRVMNSAVASESATNSSAISWNPSFDAIELLFLSYAKTLKSFAPKNQAVAKMKIAKIIMEQELLHCDQDERRDSYLEEF